MEIVGKRFKREWVYICLWLIDEVVQQNLTQHCKAVIFQKYIYISKEKKKRKNRLITQYLRIHLTVQGTWASSLVQEYSTYFWETKPVRHNC